jgi:uncharacterized protein YPO0396
VSDSLPIDVSYSGQWRLSRIELVNWGTFHGAHRIEIARQGHLITGASGSGKSSLLDAIATVLTPDRWLHFNAAAQEGGGRGDDRSLMSYVRGAWSKEVHESEDRTTSTFLRSKAGWSGILLGYENGRDAPVTLVRLFHVKGASTDRDALSNACALVRGDVTLEDFRPYIESGLEARRMKATWPDAVITTSSHGPFYERLRRVLGISKPGALHLLHKTQSAKNLGSLDQLFRDFMLDEPGTFARAANAGAQFAELRQAHAHVVDLRHQSEHLTSLIESADAYQSASADAEKVGRWGDLIETFQLDLTLRIATEEKSSVSADHARAEHSLAQAVTRRESATTQLKAAERLAEQRGGADAQQLQERVADARRDAVETSARWGRFAEDLKRVGIHHAPETAHDFAELIEQARRELAQPAPHGVHDHEGTQAYFEAKAELHRIDDELTALRQRKSNLPPALLLVRERLAKTLGISEQSLPFAGELIEVRSEFTAWAGAIERVLHPLSSALLVREKYLVGVRREVDVMHLGARLVFEVVDGRPGEVLAAQSARSLLNRVEVGAGSFRGWLTARLSAEFDYECVDSPDELDSSDRAVTIAGQIKKSARRYEKNDRFAIGDRRQWILGADNDAKVELLIHKRQETAAAIAQSEVLLTAAQNERDSLVRRRTAFESLVELGWSQLDRAEAEAEVRRRRENLALMTAENIDLQQALTALESAQGADRMADRALTEAHSAVSIFARDLADIDQTIASVTTQLTGFPGLSYADQRELEARYRAIQRHIPRGEVARVSVRVQTGLNREQHAASERARAAESVFVAGATRFITRWPAAAIDVTSNIDDREAYRALRDGIVARGLPEHEANFLRLLRERSRDTIGHLASDIRDAPKRVIERIDPVNGSLARSRFDEGRHLKIEVKTRRSAEVTTFLDNLRTVVDGAWGDDDLEAAERRYAVLSDLMRRLSSSDYSDIAWKARMLDTRQHVTFLAHEVDAVGRVQQTHDSSAGLSGGQRQKLVIFCLAAALRYQLTGDEEELPRYGTIVLDEAFDKADSRYTRMAMDVFVEFGFHMILATPEKLLQTIEPYVGAVTLVANPSRQQSLLSQVVFT